MSLAIKRCLISAALLCALGSAGQAQNTPATRGVANFVPVTDQMLRNPSPNDWLMLRGNYQGWGYSQLEQINKANVKNLQLVWARVMEPGINESTPIVHNGVMYLGNSNDVVQAIDATNGDLLWEYRHPLPEAAAFHGMLGQRKRSVALYGDNVYFVTWDNYRRRPRCPHRQGCVADQSRRRSVRQQFHRPDRGQRHGDRGLDLPVRGLRLLRHGPRRQDRRGALAQFADPAPGPARRRDLGRLAL